MRLHFTLLTWPLHVLLSFWTWFTLLLKRIFSMWCCWKKKPQSPKWCVPLHTYFALLNKIYLSLKPSTAWCCSSYCLLLNHCSHPFSICDATSYWCLIQCTIINGLFFWEVLVSSGRICPRITPTQYFKELLIQWFALMSVWYQSEKVGSFWRVESKSK